MTKSPKAISHSEFGFQNISHVLISTAVGEDYVDIIVFKTEDKLPTRRKEEVIDDRMI